ncbi:hypothetical protein NC651_033941 [Populus alba x Populus x berolinensis]|nr:hypothetical protein NC651_033941 [Populus alba x Populus x berolinensis]
MVNEIPSQLATSLDLLVEVNVTKCIFFLRILSLTPFIFLIFRSLGLISGMTGGGGNVGAVLTQLIFFKGSKYSKETGIMLMGIMIIFCTLPICFIYFPQWGGMFCGPSSTKIATEEDYYLSEWNSEEKEKGLHLSSLKFADNSRSERGRKEDSETRPVDETPSTKV